MGQTGRSSAADLTGDIPPGVLSRRDIDRDPASPIYRKRTIMCRPVGCKICGKTTWAGCGQHIASVKAGVPAGQWCSGHSKAEMPAARKGWFRRKTSGL